MIVHHLKDINVLVLIGLASNIYHVFLHKMSNWSKIFFRKWIVNEAIANVKFLCKKVLFM